MFKAVENPIPSWTSHFATILREQLVSLWPFATSDDHRGETFQVLCEDARYIYMQS
jgi:hypothetical protein